VSFAIERTRLIVGHHIAKSTAFDGDSWTTMALSGRSSLNAA